MKKYIAFILLRLRVELQYRFAAIAAIFTQLFFGFMFIFIYEAYYRNGVPASMDWQQLVSYIWIGQSLHFFTYLNLMDSDVFDSIITGQVSYELVRPIRIYWMWYAKFFARKIAGTILRFFPVITVALILPYEYSLKAPISVSAFIIFIITLGLGLILSISMGMILYGLMFYTISGRGIFSIYSVIGDFFAGKIIPLPLMPAFWQKICYALPFHLTADLPFRIYCGNISVLEGIKMIPIQLVWITVMMIIGTSIIKRASKQLVIQGG